jgi:Arc/MetJ family transcription regulator
MTSTNIVVDDELMEQAMQATGLTTKQAVVETALRLLVQIKGQSDIRQLRGKVKWEGNLDEMRQNRFQKD